MTALQWPENGRPNLAVFGFDVAEASQIRRIRSLIELGCNVISFTQRRANMNVDFQPEWPNIHLGDVGNEGYRKRATQALASTRIAAGQWRLLARADLIVARNFDLAMIAQGARRFAAMRSRIAPAPMIYECLDIHSLFTRDDRVGRVMRTAERRMLNGCAALVVSSPAFQDEYFAKIQGWTGPTILVENKLYLGAHPELRDQRPQHVPLRDGPLTIGLVGSIRCAPSVRILCETAAGLGDSVRIHMRGNVHDHAVPDFHGQIAQHPNITYAGPYDYPTGLLDAYAPCDLVWAQDLWQSGGNSDWLLPNRIYEASWAGCPQIAVETTQTGRRIAQDGLGFTLPHADSASLIDLLRRLNRDQTRAAAQALLDRPDTDFVQSPTDLAPLLDYARR